MTACRTRDPHDRPHRAAHGDMATQRPTIPLNNRPHPPRKNQPSGGRATPSTATTSWRARGADQCRRLPILQLGWRPRARDQWFYGRSCRPVVAGPSGRDECGVELVEPPCQAPPSMLDDKNAGQNAPHKAVRRPALRLDHDQRASIPHHQTTPVVPGVQSITLDPRTHDRLVRTRVLTTSPVSHGDAVTSDSPGTTATIRRGGIGRLGACLK
jgi:hypothetical protein